MNGYGSFGFCGKSRGAHCVSSELANRKDILDGLCILHECSKKNKLCVNPNHSKVGTNLENSQDEKDGGYILKGEDNPNANITKEQAQMVIDSFGIGTVKQRAKVFEVSRDVIYKIDAAESWTSLMTPEQIAERKAVVRREKNNEILSDDVIREIKNSSESLNKCVETNNTTFGIVTRIRAGTYKSRTERDEIYSKDIIVRLAKESKMFNR